LHSKEKVFLLYIFTQSLKKQYLQGLGMYVQRRNIKQDGAFFIFNESKAAEKLNLLLKKRRKFLHYFLGKQIMHNQSLPAPKLNPF